MKITLLCLGLFISQTSFAKSKPAILIFGKTLRPAHSEIIPGAIRSLVDRLISFNNYLCVAVDSRPNAF
jgi:hypothetical protein